MKKYTAYTLKQITAALEAEGKQEQALTELAKVRAGERSSSEIYVSPLNGTIVYRRRNGAIRCDVLGPDGQDFGSPVVEELEG